MMTQRDLASGSRPRPPNEKALIDEGFLNKFDWQRLLN